MNRTRIKKYLSEDHPVPRCGSLRLDDLASLIAGVKSVLYTSVRDSADAGVMDQLCSDLKLKKIVLGANRNVHKGHKVVDLLVGTDAAKMNAAARSYPDPTSFEWGVSLDYPECCVKAYIDWRGFPGKQDLVSRIHANSPGNTPFSFTTNNVYNHYSRLFNPSDPGAYSSFRDLNPGFDMDPIIPWHPCSYACAKSLRGGLKIYEVLAHYLPNRARLKRQLLSKPIVFWDKFKFAVLDGSCRKESGGFSVNYQGVCRPGSLISARTEKTLGRQQELRVSPAGAIVSPRALPLPKDYVFLPFSPRLPEY